MTAVPAAAIHEKPPEARAAGGRPAPFVLPAVLGLIALTLFVWRIWDPPVYIYDEVYHAYTAGQYAAGNSDAYVWYTHAPEKNVAYMWNHPPLGVLLIELGILLRGNDSFGWRIVSAIFGAIGVMVAWGMARSLSRRRDVALLLVIFLLADSLYFVQSRTGMLDIFGVVFMTSALWSFHRYLRAPACEVARPLLLTGLFIGLAVATKWNAAYASLIVGLVVAARALGLGLAALRNRPGAREGWMAHLRVAPLAMLVVPAAVYGASYIPFFAAGHDFKQWVELQNQIYYYHSHLKATHPYQSTWWEWPLTLRPVWYYAGYSDGKQAHIYANGSLFLYALFVPAVVWNCIRRWKSDRGAVLVLAIGFFGQWLPWALVPRIAFIYHFLPAAMFGCLAVAWTTADLLKAQGWRRVAAISYIALVVASFAYFYPIRAAVPLTPKAVQQRMWLPRWR